MKKAFPKILSALSILIFVFAIMIMILGTIAVRNNKPLYIFNYSITAIPTPSMEGNKTDSLHVGDLAIIKKLDYESIKIGDIIVYQKQNPNILVIHRVVEETPNGFITKGDNNLSPDQGFVTKAEYQGTYVNKITNLKWLTNLITNGGNKKFIFLAIVIILLILLISEFIHIIKQISNNQKEEIKKMYDEGHKKE